MPRNEIDFSHAFWRTAASPSYVCSCIWRQQQCAIRALASALLPQLFHEPSPVVSLPHDCGERRACGSGEPHAPHDRVLTTGTSK
jgi:hypothetical protein